MNIYNNLSPFEYANMLRLILTNPYNIMDTSDINLSYAQKEFFIKEYLEDNLRLNNMQYLPPDILILCRKHFVGIVNNIELLQAIGNFINYHKKYRDRIWPYAPTAKLL